MEDSYERREILKVDGKASKKRTSDSSNVKPSDSKRAKKNTGEKHNDLVSKERHSRTSKENYLDSKTHRKPLQEAKVTSSKKLTGHTKKEAASVKGDTEAEISDVGMDSPPSSCENSHDVNNNNMPSEHEEMSGREHGSSVDMDMSSDSERSVKMKHRQALDIPEGGGKHRLRVKDGDPNNDKWQETLDQTGSMKMTENRSETKKKNVKDEEAKRERKKAQNENAGKPIKEEEEEVPLQKDDQLKEKSKTKDKKIKKESKSSESKASKKDPTNATGKNKKTKTDTEGKQSKKRKKDEADDGKPGRKRGKTENAGDEDDKWKWWEEGQSHDGKKWKSLEHKGPLFPPEYDPLPENVSFYYNGKPVQLSLAAEEVATFYAKMLDHEYTTKEVFQKNFFADWRQEMTNEERDLIRSLSKCDFQEIHQYFLEQAEKKKAMTKEEKQVLKEEAQKLTEEYGYCILDGHREKIGNFRVEPPGLFRGRGEHPKMGKLKKRVLPEDITINCSEDGKIPEAPKGHKWKKVQHDNTVTWLASWVENVQGTIKYIMLNPSSKLKGEKDWQKYEIARKLKLTVDDIRKEYQANWRAREMRTRQMGVAVYFIDKLALRAGNEKEEGETADTVGCCSLRVEHITLHEQLDGQEWVVEFDFLGKDSIRYYNKVPVEKQVFKNLKLFMENKNPDDDLFDRINTVYLNKELNNFMKGLTAKVFRTYNASTTLQEQLNKLTSSEMSVEEKILAYNRANRAVAILCNHQRAAPKTFEKSMQNLQEKIELKEKQLEEAKEELQEAKKQYRQNKTEKLKKLVEQKEKAVTRLEEQLKKLKLQMTDREENKVIALGTSKLNYLDPRITVAWCKKFGVPVEKIYNKTQRDKFAWAIDMTDEDFQF